MLLRRAHCQGRSAGTEGGTCAAGLDAILHRAAGHEAVPHLYPGWQSHHISALLAQGQPLVSLLWAVYSLQHAAPGGHQAHLQPQQRARAAAALAHTGGREAALAGGRRLGHGHKVLSGATIGHIPHRL